MIIDWDKVDPGERHSDAVNETIAPLLEAIAREEGCDPEDLSWTIEKNEEVEIKIEEEDASPPARQMQLVTEVLLPGLAEPAFRIFTFGRGTAALVWDSTRRLKLFCRQNLLLPDGYRVAFMGTDNEESLELLNRIKAASVSTQPLLEVDRENDAFIPFRGEEGE